MADQKQLAALLNGAFEWSQWRLANIETAVDLSRADLSRANLPAVNLSGADLSNANLNGAGLIAADLSHAKLGGAGLSDANLSEADLSAANLSGAYLSRANLRQANLSGAYLRGGELWGADLSHANLSGAILQGADLRTANLSGAILQGADLRGANLPAANLSQADLSGADLSEADLSHAQLSGANLSQAIVGWTTFADIDLRATLHLDTVQHVGPSTIGVDTIYKSSGKIPDAFLKGCGVPDNFIVFIESLVATPIQFYSCFISYSTKNQEFADRLYADLQRKGVRCWFAPEDLKIGDPWRQRIDEAIRHYDKLLLLLSEHSVQSNWVREEVEACLEREHRQKRLVLFPVRVDDAVMETDQAWAASIRRQRHIGDFKKWKDHDAYVKSFDRLLRDLKADPRVGTIPSIAES